MGCFGNERINVYWESLNHIILESDFDSIEEDFKLYLISTESIPNYIKIINKFNLLENKNKRKNESLKKIFEKYSLENNIKILNDFNYCKDISQKKEEKQNEFIIVNENFFYINDGIETEKYVYLRVDKDNPKH